jgi:hypothetical protein
MSATRFYFRIGESCRARGKVRGLLMNEQNVIEY